MTTSIAWPSSFPQKWLLGVSVQRGDDRQITPMDLGPPKIRPRQALAVGQTDIPTIWTGSQVAAFDAWWLSTLGRGSLRFLARDPMTGLVVEMSFRARPQFIPFTAGAAGARLSRATLQLRIHT